MRVVRLVFGFPRMQHAINAARQLKILCGIEKLVVHFAGFRRGKDFPGGAVYEDHSAVRTERYHSGCDRPQEDRKSTRLNSSHVSISYAVFCLKKKKIELTHRESALLPTAHVQPARLYTQ